MSFAQLSLWEPQAPRARLRHVRRPFTPSREVGPYRLPRDIRNRLSSALASFRNRDAAYALAVFIGRFWSTPNRITSAFPLDRRELAGHSLALRLTHIPAGVKEDVFFRAHEVGTGRRHARCQASRQARWRELSTARSDHREQASASPISQG